METPNVIQESPRWAKHNRVHGLFDISRTSLWRLAKAGKIRSVSLREPGAVKATRLFDIQSIEDYIESFSSMENAN